MNELIVIGILLLGGIADGNTYSDIYPISQADWDTLKAEGYAEK